MTFKSIVNSGVDLEQLRQVLQFASTIHLGENVQVTKYIGNDGTEDDCKTAITNALSSPRSRIALNYEKGEAGQAAPGGHFSPLIAHHVETDMFLVMDCSQEKCCGPCWIPWNNLWQSINVKNAVGNSRGFVILDN